MRIFTTLLLLCSVTAAFAQTYSVGHKEKHYIDASRANRDVWTEVYYPAASAADTANIAVGQFPVVVFGHGFLMAWDRYDYLWKHLVARGYVCVLPRTEGNTSPDHTKFGADLRFLANLFGTQLNTTAGSLFAGYLLNKVAIMGHSMGGGASFLAAKNNTQITTLVNFAAANTNPPSISAAAFVSVPSLVIAGEKDCVAAPATNQVPMYDTLPNTITKYYVEIKKGSHCQFASQGSVCETGEGFSCIGQTFITRAAQNARALTTVSPWLDFYLKGNCAAWNTFQDSLTAAVTATKITERHNNAPQLPTVSITQANNTLQAVAQHSTSLVWSTSATTASISPTVSGIYTVTVTGILGCTATASANLTFVSAAEAAAFAEIQLYPNPSYEGATLYLKLPHIAALTVVMTDATGRIIHKQSFAGMNTEFTAHLPTANLPSGVYFVTAETSAGSWTGRWVKL
jgi:pimeloyl-ACP methyl ester carboxylesterase